MGEWMLEQLFTDHPMTFDVLPPDDDCLVVAAGHNPSPFTATSARRQFGPESESGASMFTIPDFAAVLPVFNKLAISKIVKIFPLGFSCSQVVIFFTSRQVAKPSLNGAY
jgi:hypothetical protein